MACGQGRPVPYVAGADRAELCRTVSGAGGIRPKQTDVHTLGCAKHVQKKIHMSERCERYICDVDRASGRVTTGA